MRKDFLIILFVMVICLSLVGCKKKENEKGGEKVNSWVLNLKERENTIEEENLKIFNAATQNYTNMKLTPVAILGEQVVAGTNYMFLASTDSGFKMVVVYHDLEDKSTITQVNDFDVLKYVNENIELKRENLVGGWNAYIPAKPIMLDEKTQNIFDKATEKLVGVTYLPITILAEQNKSGTNYAFLCYGRLSDQNQTSGIYVLTVYVDEHNTTETISIANIKLSDYSK